MLGTEPVEGSLMRPLQSRPKALYAIGVNLSLDVLGNTVLDGFMIREMGVSCGIVSVNLRAWDHGSNDKTTQSFARCVGNHLGFDLIRWPYP